MAASIEVQHLRVEDVSLARETIRAIKTHGDTSEHLSLGSDDMETWLAKSTNVLITASDDGMPVGFALGYLLDRVEGTRTMMFFYEIEVAIDSRCRGIGSRLVETMKLVAREEGVLKMWVQTHPENSAARVLYQNMGGTECEDQDLLYVWTDLAE